MSDLNHQSGEEYQSIFENALEGIFQSSMDGRFLKVNPAMARIYGYDSPEDMLTSIKTIAKQIYVDPQERNQFLNSLQDNGRIEKFEARNYRKDGSVIWTQTNARVVKDREGNTSFIEGFVTDITSRKETETALRESEERYRALVERLPGVVFLDAPGEPNKTLYISAKIADVLGYSPEEWVSKVSWSELIHPDDRDHIIAENKRTDKSGEVFRQDYRLRKKAGNYVWVREETSIVKDESGKPLFCQGFMIDITDRKKAEDELRAVAAFRQATIERVAEGLCVCHAIPDFPYVRFTVWNDRMVEITGYDMDEINKNGWYQSVYPDPDVQKAAIKRMDKMREGDNLVAEAWEITRADQEKRILSISTALLTTEDKETHVLALMQDITEKKRAEEALKWQLQELTVLHNIAMAATSSTSVDELIQRATDIISDTLHPDNCGVELVIEHGDKYQTHPSYQGASRKEIRMPMPLTKGVTGKVIATGASIRLGDVSQEPAYIEATKGIKSELCVPITIQGRVIGVVNIESKQANAFDEADERLFNTIAGTLATSIEQLRLFETSQRRLQELSIINAVSLASTHATNLDELIENITQIVCDSLYPDDFGLLLLNEEGDMLHSHPSYRGTATSKFPISVPLGRGITGQVAASGKPLRIANVRKHKGYIEMNSQVRSELCVPITLGEKILGVINAESLQIDFFTEDDERLLITIASTIATALEKLRLLDQEKKRREDAETLREATTALTASLELSTLFETILENLSRIVAFDSASIALMEGNELKIVAGKGFPESYNVTGSRIKSNGKWSAIDQKRGSLIISDAQADPEFEQRRGSEYIRGWMGVALIVRGKIIGHIFLDSRKPNFFSQRDATMVETFASAAAVAIENALRLQEENRRTKIIEAMADIANEIATTREIEPVLEKITQRALGLLQASHVAIYLIQDDNKTIKVVSAQGTHREELLSHTLKVGEGITGNIIATGKAEIVNDTTHDLRRKLVPGTPEKEGELETMMSSPLLLRGNSIGAINAWRLRSDGLFNQTELNFLIGIAHQVSISIESGRLFQETMHRAQEITAIADVGRDISATLELDSVLERIASYAKELLNAETSAVYLTDPIKPILTAIAALGPDEELIKNDPLEIGMGILGNVALKKAGEIVNDTSSDPRAIIIKGTDVVPYEHLMGVPVLVKDRLTGLVAVWRSGPGLEFKATELNFLNSLAQQAAVAINNANLFKEEQEQRQRSTVLLDLMRIASSSLELDKVLKAILSYTTRLIPSDSGSIQLLEKDTLRVATEIGLEPANILPGKVFPLDYFPLNAEIIEEKQPIRIPDVTLDERFIYIPGAEKIRAFLGVPLIIKNRAIGLINLDSYTPNKFSDSDMVLALAIANHAAFAIENARLFEAEQRRHRESETLRQAALAITTSLELESILDTILIVMKQVVPYDSACVFLQDGDELQIAAVQGFPPEVLNLRFPANDELFGAVRNSEEPVIIKDAQQDTRFKRWANTDYVRGWMGIPLILRNETIGYITLDSCQEDAYNETLATLAQAFANQAASAIQNARQFEAEQRHFQEAETLRQAAEAITSTLDIQQVLASILDNLNRVVPFDSASVFLIENDKLRLTAAKGLPDSANDQVFPASNVLLQEVWQTKSPLILIDAQKDPRFENWIINQVHGWLAVPLISRGTMIGYITIDSLQVGAYTEHHATLASTFAHQAAAAIENARLYERGEQQIRQLTILRDIDTAISSSFDLRVTLNLLIGHITRELNVDAAAILLYNPNFQALSLYTSSGLTLKRNALPSYIRIGESLAGQVALQRKSITIPNLNNAPEYKISLPMEENFTGYFGLPLTGKGQIKGVLEIYTRNEIEPNPDWLNFLRTMAGQAAIAIDNVQLFKNLQRSNQELILAYDNTLKGWGKVLELRDKETQGHTDRVLEWTIELARQLGVEGEEITHIMRGALLHDIGKLGIPDHILQKPGPLTGEEWEIMRQHPQYAFDLLNPISYLRPALDIPYCHHERWDGSGYPRGLKGENIPLAARIFAVVDIWDALLYERVYRPAWPEDQAIEYLKNTAGIELDPNIVEKFLELLEEKSYKK